MKKFMSSVLILCVFTHGCEKEDNNEHWGLDQGSDCSIPPSFTEACSDDEFCIYDDSIQCASGICISYKERSPLCSTVCAPYPPPHFSGEIHSGGVLNGEARGGGVICPNGYGVACVSYSPEHSYCIEQ